MGQITRLKPPAAGIQAPFPWDSAPSRSSWRCGLCKNFNFLHQSVVPLQFAFLVELRYRGDGLGAFAQVWHLLSSAFSPTFDFVYFVLEG